MTYSYDEQLIDATGVRRRRLTGALLHGQQRLHRQFSNLTMTLLASGLLAALISAGCVVSSFVMGLLAQRGGA